MGERIQIASINALGCKYPIIYPWVEKVGPGVLMAQEVYERDISKLREALGAEHFFYSPMAFKKEVGEDNFQSWGIAIISKYPFKETLEYRYSDLTEPRNFDDADLLKPSSRVLQIAEIVTPWGEIIRVGDTHFTWTPDGKSSPEQERDLARLIPFLEEEAKKGLILTGDFNAPRGGENWQKIADLIGKDNIPIDCQTTLFNPLHRAGGNLRALVVDGIFSTPNYVVKGVILHPGVSDHYGITAYVESK